EQDIQALAGENTKLTKEVINNPTNEQLAKDIPGVGLKEVPKVVPPVGPTSDYSVFGISVGKGIAWGSGYNVAGSLIQGIGWSAAVIAGVKIFEEIGIIPEEMSKPLYQSITAGIMTGSLVSGTIKWLAPAPQAAGTETWSGFFGNHAAGISWGAGLVVGYLIFANSYEKTKTRDINVDFQCLQWQAPVIFDKDTRSKECNKCNTDPLRTCSEYRCKSLGQTCKIINEGTALVKCIDGGVDDVNSPGIKPYDDVLTADYDYTEVKERPAGAGTGTVSGMSITYNGGCLQAWTPFEFGIITVDRNEETQPAQCKLDFNHTTSFDDMAYWFGETNLYIENHSQSISLPGTDNLETTFPEIANDGGYNLYVRCRNGNGNTNDDEFVVRFCIDKTPDLTAPVVKTTSPLSGSPVLYKIDNLSVNVYTNEPSNCKWARTDKDFNAMENNLSCSNDVWEMNAEALYTCTTTLTSIKDKAENKFYFRCQDLSAQKNTMTQGYEYTLFGTQPLTILSTGPTGIVGSSTSTANVSLSVKTDNGYKNGEATCSYSTSKDENSYIDMFNSGEQNIHSQTLDLIGGTYNYYFKCVDLGGNAVYNSTSFTVYIDKYAPQVLRFYNTESKLRLLTDEPAVCKYSTTSCNFDINAEGIISMPYDWTEEHWAEWKTDQTYYVKCMDKYNNQPDSADCSVIIRPYELSKK
ncbi:MAG: hypothetical protein AABX17_01990, partial [Nanoarchaeota archaeon]